MTDYYAVLGISRLAERDEVARAYRRSALTLNPECPPATEISASAISATESEARKAELYRRFRLVGQAYFVLSDERLRGIYDSYGEDGVRHGGTAQVAGGGVDIDAIDPDVVFRKFFGVDDPFHVTVEAKGISGQAHAFFSDDAVKIKNPPPADELVVELPISLEEAFAGGSMAVHYESVHWDIKGKPAGSTSKSMDFAVPLGVEDGASFVFKGVGHTGDQRSPGPLRVVVRIAPHPVYRREGLDLVVTASISLCQALTGVSIVVPTIDKRELTVSIDEVACHQYRCRLKGEGLPAANGAKRGDLVVECLPVFPAYLSAEQKRELKRVLNEES